MHTDDRSSDSSSEEERIHGNCYQCNRSYQCNRGRRFNIKIPELCQLCRRADQKEKPRPDRVLDPMDRMRPKEKKTGEVKCGACDKVSKDRSAYEAHCCPAISTIVNRRLNEIVSGTHVLPSIVETSARKWAGYKITKCMVCDTENSKGFEWETTRTFEQGKKRVACLDCLFDSADKKMIEKMAREDPYVTDTQETKSLKKPKLDY